MEKAIKKIIERYPEVKPHLTGYAAWLVMEDEMRQWEAKAILRAEAGDPIVCDYESDYIPDGVADMVKMMLGYADCANCVKTVFTDALAFVKKGDDKARYEKIPYRGTQPYQYNAGDDDIVTKKDIDRAVRAWDKLMPDYAGILDAENEGDNG